MTMALHCVTGVAGALALMEAAEEVEVEEQGEAELEVAAVEEEEEGAGVEAGAEARRAGRRQQLAIPVDRPV